MNSVRNLIVSSTLDYSTDLVCRELERRGNSYLRINRDLFDQYKIIYDLERQNMELTINGENYTVCNREIESIYFRAPVFYRYSTDLSLDNQLRRGQWGSFIRNLIVFDRARWINHPVATYRSENKLLQLQVANAIGIKIPHTYVGNQLPPTIREKNRYVVKALDTPVFYDGAHEMFTYSTILTGKELLESSLQEAPVIIQECLSPKVDIRVTVVNNRLFPAQIEFNGKGIEGDWRKKNKEGLTYTPIDLPSDLQKSLLSLMAELRLVFGGIDLAVCNNSIYFIEVNPTGEWGWLVHTAGFEIQKAIVDYMEGK